MISPHITRARIAQESNVSESTVRRAEYLANGMDAAEEEHPGIKEMIFSGNITPSKNDICKIAQLPKEERKAAVELLFVPKDERKVHELARQIEKELENSTEPEDTPEPDSSTSAENFQPPIPTVIEPTEAPADGEKRTEREIEECILDSMIGAVNMFIDSINNYLSRFPRLRTDPKYRGYTREIMVAARDYINDVEGDLI